MKIEPRTYFDGQVQSLAAVGEAGGTMMTVGMVLQGVYDFGKAKLTESIQVTSGVLIINGESYGDDSKNTVCVIHPGEGIRIEAAHLATYVCRYR